MARDEPANSGAPPRGDCHYGVRARWVCPVCYTKNDDMPEYCVYCGGDPHVTTADLYLLAEAEDMARKHARAAAQARKQSGRTHILRLRDTPMEADNRDSSRGQDQSAPEACSSSEIAPLHTKTPTLSREPPHENDLSWSCDVCSKSNKARANACESCGSDKPSIDYGIDNGALYCGLGATSLAAHERAAGTNVHHDAATSRRTAATPATRAPVTAVADSPYTVSHKSTSAPPAGAQTSAATTTHPTDCQTTKKAVTVRVRRKDHSPKHKPHRSQVSVSAHRTKKQSNSVATRSPQPVSPKPRRTLLSTRWPYAVPSLRHRFNPLKIRFAYDAPFFSSCGCDEPCRFESCRNAKLGVYCSRERCSFAALCGNAVNELGHLKLVRRRGSNDIAVIAGEMIDAGVVVGEYIGVLVVEDEEDRDDLRHPASNTPYRLKLKRKSKSHPRQDIFIDAKTCGSITRFINHSCTPVARFQEVRNGYNHTVVVVTIRAIDAGEVITVDYGKDLWFLCRCGEETCCHKHLQHMSDHEVEDTV